MTTTKRFISLFMAVLMTFSLLAVSASAATARRGFNVSYRMDGENIVETIVFSGATMIRTVTPAGTMTIKTIENGSTSTAKVNADYSVYKKICEAQYGVATIGSDVTGSQYKHRYVGTPGPVTITKQEVVQCRTAAALARKILGKSSIPALVAFSVAEYMLGKAVDTTTYEKVVVNSLTYAFSSLMAFRSFFSLFSSSRLSFSSFEVSGKGSVLLSRYQHINSIRFSHALTHPHDKSGVFQFIQRTLDRHGTAGQDCGNGCDREADKQDSVLVLLPFG